MTEGKKRKNGMVVMGDHAVLFECLAVANLVFTVYTIKINKEANDMAVKALNFKMDEMDILDMKNVAGIYHMSVTDLIKNAVREYITELKKDPFYRLTTNVQEASVEESAEILKEIENLNDDDLTIVSSKRLSV